SLPIKESLAQAKDSRPGWRGIWDQDLTNLSQLPCLESLSLKDPVYGPNPVALMCNYSTHLLYHLPNLKRVDSYNVDDKTLKELAETTVIKKKMYYNMRVKTLQRNKADLLFRLETERAALQANPRNRIFKLFSAVKDIEREVEEQREGLSSSFKENKNPISPVVGDEGKKENMEEKGSMAADTMMISQKLQKKKEALLKRIAKLQKQCEEINQCHQESCEQVNNVSEMTVQRLLLELETGGNVRFEDGKQTDPWYQTILPSKS
ncbi:Leucine-rich repeat-containing protein 9, partial [Stylophora pistillata]